MASFSEKYPRALHVLPLHALKSVLEDGALLAKSALLNRRGAAVRATTSRTDVELGLSEYVHFYLCGQSTQWTHLPIIEAQLLGRRAAPPFPHLVLEIATRELTDPECTLCLWNAAISRPAVEGYCRGGNWTRGTHPPRILEVWRRFRDTDPDAHRARGYWNGDIQLPTLCGDQIRRALPLLRRAPRGMPELLLKSPVPLRNRSTLWAFSDDDFQVIHILRTLLEVNTLNPRFYLLPEYDSPAQCTRAWRATIAAHFSGRAPFPAELDFDRKR